MKLEALKDLITLETYEAAKNYSYLKKPDDLYRLAQLEENISGRLHEAYFTEKTGRLLTVFEKEGGNLRQIQEDIVVLLIKCRNLSCFPGKETNP